MSAAGVDVSKGKSIVSVLRPLGQVVAKSFIGSELMELAKYLKSLEDETREVIEHTGRYYEPTAQYLCEAGDICQRGEPEAHQRLWEQFSAQGQNRQSGFQKNSEART